VSVLSQLLLLLQHLLAALLLHLQPSPPQPAAHCWCQRTSTQWVMPPAVVAAAKPRHLLSALLHHPTAHPTKNSLPFMPLLV
jgi:hypothetical protein